MRLSDTMVDRTVPNAIGARPPLIGPGPSGRFGLFS
jgi:hypothetical protein